MVSRKKHKVVVEDTPNVILPEVTKAAVEETPKVVVKEPPNREEPENLAGLTIITIAAFVFGFGLAAMWGGYI